MFIIILLIWIILNGRFTLEVFLFGLGVSLFVYLFLIKFTRYTFKTDLKFMKKIPLIIAYGAILTLNVITSNLNVIKLILKPKATPKPEIVHISLDLKSNFVRTLVANSITLTPGTITVSLDDNKYTVHCLKKEYFDGFEDSLLIKLAKRLEA